MENITQGTIYLVMKCAPAEKRDALMEQAKGGEEMDVLQYLMADCNLSNDDKMYLMGLLQ